MIDAYIVRDPQGRVIGISVSSYNAALNEAFDNHIGPLPIYWLEVLFEDQGSAAHNGYTLRKEPVDL